jgi:protein-disulfide isomerase
LFQELLSKNKLVDSDSLLSDDNRIFFGSKNPKLVIIAVTNPLCGFCTESFQIYYELLSKYEEIQINFVFSLFTNDKDNPAYKIINTFLELYNNKSKADAIQSLKNWYELKDFDIWMKKYDQVFNQNQFTESILKKHNDWLVKNNISNTPTTLINNNYYPNEYNIKDILYLIDDIIFENKK